MRFRVNLIAVLLLLALTSCAYKMRPAGVFYKSFTLPDHVIKSSAPQLQHLQTGSSDGSSAGDPTQHRRSFHMMFNLNEKPEHRWNEELFIANFMSAIQRDIQVAGYKARGEGREGNNIHIEFEASDSDRHYGSIDVYFVRAENRQYEIFGTVREAVFKK